MAESTTTELVRRHEGREVPHPGTYRLDPSHSAVEFVARHLMISKVRGRFADFEGRIVVADVPRDSSVEVTIRADSVDSDEPTRDAHLRSPDFFDAERYPTITFRSTRIEPGRSGTWEVQGDLTVRDVTQPVTLEVEFFGATRDPWGNQRLGFSATAEVDREAWGLTWNQALESGGWLVGKKIKVELNVEAIRSEEGAAAA